MNTFLPVVNQKRYYAQLLLGEAEKAAGQRPLEQALVQGGALQLRQAVRFYLGEIATNCHCRDPESIADLRALIVALQLQGKMPGEVTELYNLEQDEESWLALLDSFCRSLESAPQASEARQTPAEGLIAVVAVHARHDWSYLPPKTLGHWLSAFGELVDRQREAMVEC